MEGMIVESVARILIDMRAKADGKVGWQHRSTFHEFKIYYQSLVESGLIERIGGPSSGLVISRLGRDKLIEWETMRGRKKTTTRMKRLVLPEDTG